MTPIEIPGVTDAAELAVEWGQTCARRANGRVACWTKLAAPSAPALEPVDRVFAGNAFTCASRGKTTKCWGTRSWTGCRWHSEDNCQFDHLATPTTVRGLLDVPGAIALADPCVLLAAGTVECAAGDDDLHAIRIRIGAIATATQISARCAVETAGTVACWSGINAKSMAKRVAGITDAIEVVSGASHECVLTRDGRVSCWGGNRAGQLGDGTHRSRTTPAPIADLAEVVQLAAGMAFTCARTKSGGVWCWGSNEAGALGDGSGRDQARPVRVSKLTDVVELRASRHRVCARRANGRVACWGHAHDEVIDEAPVGSASVVETPESPD